MASSVYTQSGISVRSPGQTYCRSNSTAPSLAPLRAALAPTTSPLIPASVVPVQRDFGCDPRIWSVYGVLDSCQGSRETRLNGRIVGGASGQPPVAGSQPTASSAEGRHHPGFGHSLCCIPLGLTDS